MKKKFAALGKRWKKGYQSKRIQNSIGPVVIILLFVFTALVSMARNPEEENYQLVDSFYITSQGPDDEEEIICNLFLYGNKETSFNVDLIVVVDIKDKVFLVREANEKGHLGKRESLPNDFPSDKIPKAIKKVPKKLLQREMVRRTRDEKKIGHFKRTNISPQEMVRR